MEKFDPEIFETKFKISEAAVSLYEEHRKDFTLKQVADQTDQSVADIFEYFPNKNAILLFYYEALIVRYRLMLQEIENFEEYLLAEKLSNFVYTTFDLLKEHETFVQKTFKSMVVCSYSKTAFEKQSKEVIQDFFTSDPRISSSSSMLMNAYFFSVLYNKYIALIHFWLRDDSEDKEASMELTDKYTAFLQELMYSAAIYKGFDLARFLFSNNVLGKGFQSIKKLFPEIEIRD